MFTLEQIVLAHSKLKSGAEFPKYIQEIKEIGVIAFETWVYDSHTEYFGKENFRIQSKPIYEELHIVAHTDKGKFEDYLKIHQRGGTDYLTFCKHCAETGIKRWVVNLEKMTCIYYDKEDREILIENVPTL